MKNLETKGHKLATSHDADGHKSATSQDKSSHKSATSQDHRPFGPNVLTLQERITEFCSIPRSMTEIAEFLGVKTEEELVSAL